MKKIEINTPITIFENIDELPADDLYLLTSAKEATYKSYAPYSNFNVGCAILLDNGEIISGANQENAAYPACICAERVALSAISCIHPNAIPIKMAIVAINQNKENTAPAAPCGECRQAIYEWEKRHNHPIEIFMRGETGEIYKVDSVAELLPLAFKKDDLI
ncbi:MAG: cytidine deaminase [Chitinophagales bacterium]